MALSRAPKRIALVDIDGTLLIDGKPNSALIQRLHEQKYDQIWLFTQRNKYLQSLNIVKAVDMESSYATTEKLVDYLKQNGLVVKGVSTSLDDCLGVKPGQYYDHELKTFEASYVDFVPLKALFSKGTRDLNDAEKQHRAEKNTDYIAQDEYFTSQVKAEHEAVRVGVGQSKEMVSIWKPERYYPNDKVAQYRYLSDMLQGQIQQDVLFDFYDDSIENLEEISDSRQISSYDKPDTIWVNSKTGDVYDAREIKKVLDKRPFDFAVADSLLKKYKLHEQTDITPTKTFLEYYEQLENITKKPRVKNIALPVGTAGVVAGTYFGATLGMKAGALLGGLLGTAVPGIGNAIGLLAGAIVGGFIGGVIGAVVGVGLGYSAGWLGQKIDERRVPPVVSITPEDDEVSVLLEGVPEESVVHNTDLDIQPEPEEGVGQSAILTGLGSEHHSQPTPGQSPALLDPEDLSLPTAPSSPSAISPPEQHKRPGSSGK